MKQGKVPENVLKRSILNKLTYKRSEVSCGASVGEDCACLRLEESENTVLSTNPSAGNLRAIISAANNVASAGAEPFAVSISLLLPEGFEEEDLKKLMTDITALTDSLKLQVMGGHTEVSKAVNSFCLNATVAGRVKKGEFLKTGGAKPGDDVVITKWIGLEGTAILAKEREEELLKKFPSKYIYDSKNFDKFLSVVPEAATAIKSGVTAMHDVTKGGVFSGLWELAESSGVGLLIDLRKIPVKQETIEICNYFDINPYELTSMGALLCTSHDGNRLVLELAKEGIEATVIGKVTDNNDRVLINGENKRFLEPPKTDEIYKFM